MRKESAVAGRPEPWHRRLGQATANAGLVVASVLACFLFLEGALFALEKLAPPAPSVSQIPPPTADADDLPADLVRAAGARYRFLTMRPEWERRPVTVDGAYLAHMWQGALEIRDQRGFRQIGPYPPKRDDVYRILLVGDSLTYGDGIDEKARYGNLLQSWLGQDFRIEVINLGHDGFQSEDVLKTTREFVPQLRPNLVIYGVCLNDFLPSGEGEYGDVRAYPFPLPEAIKSFLIAHTRSGALLNELYDRALRRLRLRTDFFDDILKNYQAYQDRFARDVRNLNKVVISAGLPPVVSLVLDQYPAHGGRGYRITQAAERYLREAGAEVIATENFYRRYDHASLYVSRWEGHPNEVANWIWAKMLASALRDRPDLAPFRRDPANPG